MTRRMFDAAWPPEQPPQVDVVNWYIGGETPHVWTQAEIDTAIAKSGARWVLPNFVRVPPTSKDPVAEADWCLRWLADHQAPKGCTLALDYETAIDNTYLGRFDARVVAGGYLVMVYGTRRTVLQNHRPSGGYWTAHWTNVPHLCSDHGDQGVVATQYGGDTTLGQPWDINLVADSVPFWDVTGQEDDMTIEELERALSTPNSVVRNKLRELALLGSQDTLRTAVAGGKDKAAGPYFQALARDVAELKTTLEAGVKVSLDVTQLTPDQLALIGSVFAGKVVITGIQASSDGTFTVNFAAAA